MQTRMQKQLEGANMLSKAKVSISVGWSVEEKEGSRKQRHTGLLMFQRLQVSNRNSTCSVIQACSYNETIGSKIYSVSSDDQFSVGHHTQFQFQISLYHFMSGASHHPVIDYFTITCHQMFYLLLMMQRCHGLIPACWKDW